MKTALNHYHWMKEKAEYFWIILLHFCIFLLFFYYLRYVFSLFSRLAHPWSTVTGKRKDPGRRGNESLGKKTALNHYHWMKEKAEYFLIILLHFCIFVIFLLLTICFQFVFQTSPSLEYCHWQDEGPRTIDVATIHLRTKTALNHYHWMKEKAEYFWIILHFCIFSCYFSITYDMFSVCFSRLAHPWSTVTGKRKDPGRSTWRRTAWKEDCTEPLSLDEGEGWVFLDYFVAFLYFSVIFLLLTICFQFVFQTSPSLEYCHWQEEGPRTTWQRIAWKEDCTEPLSLDEGEGWVFFDYFVAFLYFCYFSITYDMFSVCFPD